jgi:hypothetical protein
MRFRYLSVPLLFYATCALAQDPMPSASTPAEGGSTSGAMQASNLLNPNISAIGWFQAEAGHRHPAPGDAEESGDAFQMKEVELAFQAVVDNWARADFILSAEEDSVGVEEGTITWFRLPAALALKAGKFKANFGRFNRIHTAETAFADRPLVEQNYFGAEGLNGPGASLSWQIPNPWLFLNLDLEGLRAPIAEDTPSFDRVDQKGVMGVGRLSGYYDLSETWNIISGGSYAIGPAGPEVDVVSGSSNTLQAQLVGADLTLRWKNPRRAIYRSFMWTTEAIWSHHETAAADPVKSHGFFSHMDYQFAQRWHSGLRYDWSQFPGIEGVHEEGQLAYLTFYPSEFSLISLQGRHIKRADGANEHLGFLKVTFNIGPHGAHPF